MKAIIISPYEKTQRVLEEEVLYYFDAEFKQVIPKGQKVSITKFGNFKELEGLTLATPADILAIFDRRMCPPPRGMAERRKSQTSFLSATEISPELVKLRFDMYVKLYTSNGVPTILYQGELERNVKGELDFELTKVRDEIAYRISMSRIA